MVHRVTTVAFEGIEARAVDVQVQVAPGLPHFAMVGLPDKAVSEAKERVRAALVASGLALPARRITVNLAPADLPKEGSHYDLPIALGLMAEIGAIPSDALSGCTVLGELGLDGSIAPVAGVLPAAIGANARQEGLICPAACGPEAAWASPEMEIIAASSLIQLANHFRGTQLLARPQPKIRAPDDARIDLKDIKGQESAKRALEVAAAGGHNLLLVGPPGAGKSMLAARLPTILPPLTPAELLEVSMVASVAGEIEGGALTNQRPFRSPHHSASMAALVGGGLRVRPGEVSLAHHGVLFLDELPEFQPRVLDSLRQPLETGEVAIARANHHLSGPLHAGGGHESLPLRPRRRSGLRLQARPERALRCRLPGTAVGPADRPHRPARGGAGRHRRRSDPAAARRRQPRGGGARGARPRAAGRALCGRRRAPYPQQRRRRRPAPGRGGAPRRLSARGYHRVLRVARTLADLDGAEKVGRVHLAEALSYRALADEMRRAA
jgi:magnesium chelatase family protein